MRIALVTFEFPPEIIGGAGKYALNITQAFEALGHDVTVIMPSYIAENLRSCSPRVKYVGVKIHKSAPLHSVQFWYALPGTLRRESRLDSFDFILFNGLSYSFHSRILQSPQVLIVHHVIRDVPKPRYANLFSIDRIGSETGPFMRLIEAWAVRGSDLLIANSGYVKDAIRKYYGSSADKAVVVSSGIESPPSRIDEGVVKKARTAYAKPDERIILFIGRVDDYRKGLDVLIDALPLLPDRIGWKLVVAGSGNRMPIEARIKKLGLRDRVVLLGYVKDETIQVLYEMADVCVFPSRIEGFGRTIVDGILFQKQVICTRVGSIPEVVGNCARIVESERPDLLGQAIVESLCVSEAGSKREDCSKLLEKKFTWKATAQGIINSFDSLK